LNKTIWWLLFFS